MDWRSHMLIGAALTLCVFYLTGTRDLVQLALFGILGAFSALVPDLDHDSSKGRKWLDGAFTVFALLSVYLGSCGGICIPTAGSLGPMAILFFAMIGAYFILFRFFKPRHRGITHTIFACAVFAVGMYFFFGLRPAIAGLSGYFSHLLADQHVKMI